MNTIRIKRTLFSVLFLLSMVISGTLHAKSYPLPPAGSNVIGKIFTVNMRGSQSLGMIARRHNVGHDEIVAANSPLARKRFTWLNLGRELRSKQIIVPDLFILPDVPWKGIVINIAEKRLFYFPPNSREVITFPVGVGKEGSGTPLMTTRITEKKKNPEWRPPQSVRDEVKAKGIILPDVVKPGPDNPLGKYAMRLGRPNYLIHGTINPWGVGKRVTAGCIRLYPEDIATLFSRVPVGTPVRIIHQAYKAGWSGRYFFLEAHSPLTEHAARFDTSTAMRAIRSHIGKPPFDIDWKKARSIGRARDGVPYLIGQRFS